MNATTFRASYGPWALITGASEGIGYTFAEQVAALGLNVVLVARRLDRLETLASALRAQHGIEAVAVAADVSTDEGLSEIILGWQGVPRSAHYAATKAHVQSLAEGLRVELEPDGIDVLAVAPGPVDGGFAARADMRMRVTVLPATVARESLNALGRRGTVIPGGLSKLMTYVLLPLPRALRTRILARVMTNMTRHQARITH